MAYTEDVNVNLNILAGAMGGITAIMGGMSALTSTFGEFGTQAVDNFGAIDGLLVTTTALMVSFGVQAAQSFGEFEQGMKIVQAVSGQSSSAIQELTNQANQMSVQYRTAIGDITEGLQTLGRAGLNSAATQIEVLESGLQTAKLEGRNLNGVLEEIIQNTAMLGGDLKSVDFGEQSEYLNSLMVGTSMTAPIDSHDISQTLQYAGGTAAAAGANLENKDKLEDLMGTVAAFAQKGVTGSMAGTALRAFFTKPASQDKSVTDALGSLNLSPEDLWEDGGESMKKVSDQIAIIQRHMDALHLSTMDQVELWGKIVGPKMGQQMMKLDASSIRELTSDIQDANSAEELAAQTLNTYSQNVAQLSQQGDIVFREFGSKAVMFLNPVVEVLNLIGGALANPWVNTTVFAALMGLITNGIRTAWGMIQNVYRQIRAILMDVRDGIGQIGSSAAGVADGFSQPVSRVEVLNSKLMETNHELQMIQGNALGIGDKMTWSANGGRIEDQIRPGVISSMERNMLQGGVSSNGMQAGIAGQYYRLSDKAGLEQQMKDQSAANKAQVDRVNAASEKLAAEIQRVENRLSGIDKRLSTYKGYGAAGGNPELIDEANAMFGTRATTAGGALRILSSRRKSLEASLENIPKDDVRAKMMEEAGVTEEDIAETRRLIQAKKEAEQAYIQARNAYADEKVARAKEGIASGKYTIKQSEEGYLRKTREKAESDFNKTKEGAALLVASESSYDHLRDSEVAAKSMRFVDMPTGQYEETMGQIERIKQLEAEIKQTSGANLQKLIEQAETERQSVLLKLRELYAAQGALPSPTELETLFPQMNDKEIKALMKELTTKLQTQIQIVEEEVYQAEMARLNKLAATNPIAAQTFADNMEVEDAGYSKVKGAPGYRQMVINSPVQEKPSEVVGMAIQNEATNNAKKMANAMESASAQAAREMQGLGGRIRSRLQQAGQAYTNQWGNLLSAGAQRIGLATQSVQLSIQGLATAIEPAGAQIQMVSEEFAMSGMTFEEAMAQLTAATNLTAEQIAMLALSEEAGTEEWITSIAAMVAANDTEIIASENLVRAKLAEAASSSTGAATKALGGLSGAVSSVVGYMGGPLMAGMMAFTFASQAYSEALNSWKNKMNEANTQLGEAKDKVNTAEENIKELYSSENSTISEADLDKIVDYQYGSIQESYNADLDKHGRKTKPKFSDMYDNEVIKVENLSWSDEEKEKYQVKTSEDLQKLNDSTETLSLKQEDNVKKLEENTMALNSATYAYSQALNKKAMAFNDPMFGYRGSESKLTNLTGVDGMMHWLLTVPTLMSKTFTGKSLPEQWTNAMNLLGYDTEGFFDHNIGVLTPYQRSENYEGSQETSALLSTDMYQLGVEGGLKQFFGSDYKNLVNSVDQINHKTGSTLDYFKSISNQGFKGMDDDDMAMAQMLWKEDPETIQKLGKQMFRYEQEHGLNSGHSAMEDWQTGNLKQRNPKEKNPSSDKYYKDVDKKKYTVTDKNLKNTMEKIYRMTDGKLSYNNILAMGQMQMLSDMYNVANEQIYPTLSQTMMAANQNVLATGTAGSNAASAASGAGAAANNAAVIAGMLGEKLKQDVGGLEFENDYMSDPNGPKSFFGWTNPWIGDTLNKEQFLKGYNDPSNHDFDKYRLAGAKTEAEFSARMQHPDWSQDQVAAYAERSRQKIFSDDGTIKDGVSKDWQTIQNTILKPGLAGVQQMVESAYDQSQVGEYGGKSGGSGSGGGSGGGSGSDGSDKKSGSTTSRVDLVLCSKKEIPKLNVNLFKKPPQFTVLSKNFKLDNLQITTQDKPDAIMNAVKNGLIDTQQRLDPKIVQDEQAVYDPLASTDGSLPNGKSKVTSK